MRIAAMIMGLIFPACAGIGARGVPSAAPLDLARLQRPTTPNTALVAPAGLGPKPDIQAPRYAQPVPALYAALRRVAESEPRTYLQSADDAHFQAQYVVRSAFFNFPDLVTLMAVPDGAGSQPVIYSRSLYGHSDLGVNRRRVVAWLARLPDAVKEQP